MATPRAQPLRVVLGALLASVLLGQCDSQQGQPTNQGPTQASKQTIAIPADWDGLSDYGAFIIKDRQ